MVREDPLFDVLCLGIMVADVVAHPVSRLPRKGTLETVDRMGLHAGGCAVSTGISLAKLGLRTGIVVALSVPIVLAVVFVFGVAERHLRAWLAFGCALLLVLVLQPMAALQTGFWLSFLAVAALIFVFSGRVRRPTRLQLLWQPQLVIAIALAGPLLLAGQPQAILAPLVNALAIPLVDLVVVPCALLGCLLLPLGDVLAWPLLRMALLALDLLWWLLAHAASWNPPLPEGGGVSVETWRVLLALGGTIWLLLPRGFPARAIGLVLMLPLLLPARAAPAMLELWVLDVGQGSAVIVRTREHTLVYDTGPRFSERFDAGRAIVAPALRNTGDPRVDLLLILSLIHISEPTRPY